MGMYSCPWGVQSRVSNMLDPRYRNFRKERRSSSAPGQAHELTFTCYKRLPLLSKGRTRTWFIEALDHARVKCAFELWAYVIMPEHAHVLLLPTRDDYDISLILQSIKQPIARRATNYLRQRAPGWLEQLKVTWPTGRVEHRFWQQGGGYDRNVVEPKTAWSAVDYFHLNPVRRGLVGSATEWMWSSARWYAGLDNVVLQMDSGPPDVSPGA
jgi:putative transposase